MSTRGELLTIVERVNKILIEEVATSAETQSWWDESLPEIVWGFNNTINSGTAT